MADASAIWQTDLAYGPTSDLLLVNGSEAGRQRVLRRLLTNPGDYFAHPAYGAGLPAKVGSLANAAEVEAVVRSQMLLERAVAQDPPPTVAVSAILNGLAVRIGYNDAVTSEPVLLGFDINR